MPPVWIKTASCLAHFVHNSQSSVSGWDSGSGGSMKPLTYWQIEPLTHSWLNRLGKKLKKHENYSPPLSDFSKMINFFLYHAFSVFTMIFSLITDIETVEAKWPQLKTSKSMNQNNFSYLKNYVITEEKWQTQGVNWTNSNVSTSLKNCCEQKN